MNNWKTQEELEAYMSQTGQERARRMMDQNVGNGRVEVNPYSTIVYRRFVAPLAQLIREDKAQGGASIRKSHIKLLRGLDEAAVAYIAVRSMFHTLMRSDSCSEKFTSVAIGMARTIQGEQILMQLENADPETWFYFLQDLDRRKSKDPDHRIQQARKRLMTAAIEPLDWGIDGRAQVGAYLISQLQKLGMVDVTIRKKKKTQTKYVELSGEVFDIVGDIMKMTEETMPYFLPCIEKPRDWIDVHTGGYHTEAMRLISGPAIMNGNPGGGDISIVLGSINALQGVKWAVNVRMLETAKRLKNVIETDELVSLDDRDKPTPPEGIRGMKKEEMSEQQKAEFKRWKLEATKWYTSRKVNRQSFVRMSSCFSVAELFKDEREIFFVYSADFRGRVYPSTLGINPQGSDLQKALLQFSEGKPLRTKEARDWFFIHGAGKFGVDKVSLEDRIQWVNDHRELIIGFAEDPEGNRGWLEADKPMQFLAWCFEFADFDKYGAAFVSHIPVSMDGSCNGLQQFSALLRDEVGGAATNLLASKKPRDIYADVAAVATDILKSRPQSELRDKWVKHMLNRKLVKRSVMTLPYGSTRFSCSEFIVQDYMRVFKPEEFTESEYHKAATFLSHVVWEAIGRVVIKAREGMDWLQKSSDKILAAGFSDIRWLTPTGFQVVQRYQEFNKPESVFVNVFGSRSKLRVSSEGMKASKRRHRNGLSPNFIHSLDSSHMQLVAISGRARGMSMAMIHDDFGTHAADAAEFGKIIREEFVRMYEKGDWLSRFYENYSEAGVDLDPPPHPGSLNIRLVLESPFFFA